MILATISELGCGRQPQNHAFFRQFAGIFKEAGPATDQLCRAAKPELVLEKGWLDRARLDDILSPDAMTKPRPMPQRSS